MGFTLCNGSSINLNFITYVVDIYKKENLYSKNGFLNMKELDYNIQAIWNNMVEKYKNIKGIESNSSFMNWDREFLQQKDSYRVLFKNTEEGYQEYLNIWDNYFNWWYKEGQAIINKKTDEFIPIIYKLVTDKLVIHKVQLPSDNFAIQIIFNEIPNGCFSNGTLFTIESINNFHDEYKINEVSERLYKLILSNFDNNS